MMKTRLWLNGTSEHGLLGFVSKAERDAAGRGEPGPFKRVVRPDYWPVNEDARAIRFYLAGELDNYRPGGDYDG